MRLDAFFKGGEASVVRAALPYFCEERLEAFGRTVQSFKISPPFHEDSAHRVEQVDDALFPGSYQHCLCEPNAEEN